MYKEYAAHGSLSFQPRAARTDGLSVSAPSKGAGGQWCLMICSIVVELLALCLFLWMGGVFALVGPWMILAIRVWTTWRAEKGSTRLDLQGRY